MKLTVFLSGGGSNFQAILDAISNGQLENVDVLKVISDRECHGINRAIQAQIEFEIVSRKQKLFQKKLEKAIPEETDYIILAGFLSILPASIIERFKNKIVNIHPSLLPKFGGKGMYGMNVHKAVIEAQEEQTGCTVHLVDVGIDTGQTLFQRSVSVHKNDTPQDVQKRVLEQEHQVFPIAIKYLSQLHQANFPNAVLKSGQPISDAFLEKGITTFQSACHFVKNLPYHRNLERDSRFVLKEMKGVCSTKHALLKQLAKELDLPEITMILGVFKMNAENTPKVAHLLEKYSLDFIPEAHTYFRVNGVLIDLTRSESFTAKFESDLLHEQEYLPNQIGDWKVDFHKNFLSSFIKKQNWKISLDQLWQVREECINALFTA